ncbi:MAG: hypothetical protein OEY10_00185 [Nitrosopumilus sp.]|nr:hypothetical protein [Nitrosopumilus sp.]
MSKKKPNEDKTITGWVGKSVFECYPMYQVKYSFTGILIIDNSFNVYKKRGKRSNWSTPDWPPVKVTISIKFGEGEKG